MTLLVLAAIPNVTCGRGCWSVVFVGLVELAGPNVNSRPPALSMLDAERSLRLLSSSTFLTRLRSDEIVVDDPMVAVVDQKVPFVDSSAK